VEKLGMTVIANEGYDPKAPNYDALFEQIKSKAPDAVSIGAIIDNNGGQLVKDKVKILGDNEAVKLIGPDGMLVNDLPTDEQAGTAAEGMYLTFSGLGPDQIKERGGAAAEFLTAYEGQFGKPEVYTVYGAAAMQAMLKAIAASDGSRESVVTELFKVKVPKEESLLGEEYSFDENGDTTLKDMSVFRVKGTDIPFEKAIAVDAALLEA
jgi:branched-chain amino acid transport system substrate-binding protein